jgi:hypothetical protein
LSRVPRQALMSRGELSGGKCSGDRKLTSERNRGAHLRERICISRAGETEDLKTGVLARKTCSATDGADG